MTTSRQVFNGAMWMVLFKLVDKGIGLISTLILARLLAPSDFGLVAMAMAVVAFTQLMSAFGFDSALIQRADSERRHYDTAWTFNVIFGVCISTVLLLLAWPMAGFYGDPRLKAILVVLAFSTLVTGFENIGVVAFRKSLDFRSEFKFLFSKRVAGFAVTMICAITLRSYWALVIGVVFTRLLSVLISYLMHPYRPRFTLAARGELMHFSQWVFLSSLIMFVTNRSTDFVLGRTVGAHGLGIYSIANEIATMPSSELIAPVNRAVFPVYAKLAAESRHDLQERFLQVFGMICWVAIPVSAGLFAAADSFVRVVLGSQWIETVTLIRVFALCGLISALQSNLYILIVALGKPQANTLLSALLAVFGVPIIIWASLTHGVEGASYAMLLQAIVGWLGIWISFLRHTQFSARRMLSAMMRPFASAGVMLTVMMAFDAAFASAWTVQVPRLLCVVAVGAATYCAVVFPLWLLSGRPDSAESHVLGFIRQRMRLQPSL